MAKSIKSNLLAINFIVLVLAIGIVQLIINLVTLQFEYVETNIKQVLFGAIGTVVILAITPLYFMKYIYYGCIKRKDIEKEDNTIQIAYKRLIEFNDMVNKNFNTKKFIKGIPFTEW